MKTPEPVRLAVIGAGVFAHRAHLPVLNNAESQVRVLSICDRDNDAARSLAAAIPGDIQLCSSVDEVLCDERIEAVDVILPPLAAPAVIESALAHGKHVISEKPIAPDKKTGERLVNLYRRHPDLVWCVAENWRHETAIRQAAQFVAEGAIGRVLAFHWVIHYPVYPGHAYYNTGWRRSADFRGGLLMDGGVHHMAALRCILGPIQQVSAMTAFMRPDFPGGDTLSVSLRFENGVVGTYYISYSARSTLSPALHLSGEAGSLTVSRQEVILEQNGRLDRHSHADSDPFFSELVEFSAAVRHGADIINTPAQALQDVAILEAILESAASGMAVSPPNITQPA